jgi:hypothetical protein
MSSGIQPLKVTKLEQFIAQTAAEDGHAVAGQNGTGAWLFG